VNFFFEGFRSTLDPKGIRIGEWVILFSENFEGMGMGMGMGMGNSKKLCV